MQAKFTLPQLVEVGSRVINVCYLIMSEKIANPDSSHGVLIHLESGLRVSLGGDEASQWLRALAALIDRPSAKNPGPGSGPGAATETKRGVGKRRKIPRPTEEG